MKLWSGWTGVKTKWLSYIFVLNMLTYFDIIGRLVGVFGVGWDKDIVWRVVNGAKKRKRKM
jgi:hypothetical protein